MQSNIAYELRHRPFYYQVSEVGIKMTQKIRNNNGMSGSTQDNIMSFE